MCVVRQPAGGGFQSVCLGKLSPSIRTTQKIFMKVRKKSSEEIKPIGAVKQQQRTVKQHCSSWWFVRDVGSRRSPAASVLLSFDSRIKHTTSYMCRRPDRLLPRTQGMGAFVRTFTVCMSASEFSFFPDIGWVVPCVGNTHQYIHLVQFGFFAEGRFISCTKNRNPTWTRGWQGHLEAALRV